ncbi:MAG TPA: hypothetical protein VJ486_00610 [Geothrix sp.]|nr:hypothetical protein [Geothrix sp.]
MGQVTAIIDAYREGLIEQSHSVRVKCITDDLGSLVEILTTLSDRALTIGDQEKVRNRIKAWNRETRQWVALLPTQVVAAHLPDRGEISGKARFARLKACWLEADGACFAPPPQKPRILPSNVPDHFQPAPLGILRGLETDPLDRKRPTTDAPAWTPKPGPLLELLGFAEEALLLEAGGADRGGRTTFSERRRNCSLRDAFAFSCVVTFERALGPKSARQSQTFRRRIKPTTLEQFIVLVQEAAIGGEVPKEWALGPDPLRRAIKVQRAWQKLFQAAGVADGSAFGSLPEDARLAALQCLKPQIQARLRQPVVPWV